MWDDTSPHLFEPWAARKVRLAAERAMPRPKAEDVTPPVDRRAVKAEILRRLGAGQARRVIANALGVSMRRVHKIGEQGGFKVEAVDLTYRNTAILAFVEGGHSYSEVADAFGVTRSVVSGVVRRWRGRLP
jgi:DNA-binding CsgD family transcriptional regulator